MKNTKIKYAYILWGIVMLSACNSQNNAVTSNQMSAAADSESYVTQPIEKKQAIYTLSLAGELRPFDEVSIYAKVEGFVKEIYVDRGSEVRKGQLLALLEAPEIEQQYLSQKAAEEESHSKYIYAEQNYKRLKNAFKTKGAVAEGELEQAENLWKSAESAYKAAQAVTKVAAQLSNYLKITAPFDGVIMEKNISTGALVGKGSAEVLFAMAKRDELRLMVAIPEKHAASVYDSLEATFSVGAQPGKFYQAKLGRSSQLINRNDKSLTLEFDVQNTAHEFNGGEYAQVELPLKRKYPTYFVPKKSVLHTQKGDFVLILHQDEIKRISVKEGVSIGDKVEIFGALKEDFQVLRKPKEEIKEGKIEK